MHCASNALLDSASQGPRPVSTRANLPHTTDACSWLSCHFSLGGGGSPRLLWVEMQMWQWFRLAINGCLRCAQLAITSYVCQIYWKCFEMLVVCHFVNGACKNLDLVEVIRKLVVLVEMVVHESVNEPSRGGKRGSRHGTGLTKRIVFLTFPRLHTLQESQQPILQQL